MGRIRRGARRLAEAVARRVSRNELFEQPGERPRAAPLPPLDADGRAASGSQSDDDTGDDADPEGADGAAASELCRAADLAALRAALGPGNAPRVVNHWATWCAPCIEELPHLRQLAADLPGGSQMLGVSWDLFDPRGDTADTIRAVAGFSQDSGLDWPSLLVTAPADAFFDAFDIGWQKIPQTWVLAADGSVLRRFEGVVDEAGCAEIRALLVEASP